MDTNEFAVLKLFVVGVLVNAWMMRGASAADSFNTELNLQNVCDETRLQVEMEFCGAIFRRDMSNIDPQNWCNLTHFLREYHFFTYCTESKALEVDCYWPNPQVESFIISVHKRYFSNCTSKQVVWVDPPDDTLAILILVPIFLTLAMIALVVWCSKRSDILA